MAEKNLGMDGAMHLASFGIQIPGRLQDVVPRSVRLGV